MQQPTCCAKHNIFRLNFFIKLHVLKVPQIKFKVFAMCAFGSSIKRSIKFKM